jgi:putative membrane protein
MLNMLALIVKLEDLLPVLLTTIIFVVLGLVVFGIAFLIVTLVTPFSIRKEIEDDQNTALGIVIGSMIIGIAIIIAAAING